MDYAYITSKDRRQGLFAMGDEKIGSLFGSKEDYQKEMAKTFFASNDPSIWNEKEELNLGLSWLNTTDRKKKKNVWGELKKLMKALSTDPQITNRETHKYGKVTLGQLILFTTLLRIRKRMV